MIVIKHSKGQCLLSGKEFATQEEADRFIANSSHAVHCGLYTVNTETKKPVVYMAHPVSGQPLVNVFATVAWINALVKLDPSRVYTAPWLGEVLAFQSENHGDSNYRGAEAALGDDLEILSRFDEIILVGGTISGGMLKELNKAKELKLRITDLSKYKTPRDLPDGFFLDPNEETA